MMRVKDLRDSFIEYFKSKGHAHIHSSTLIPKDDPSLLFTTAGMVQFKPHFAGTIDVDYNSATTVQKCLRTSDLENVGRTKRHCTFFEMLGNFAFGSYFKKEAISYAWDYSTNVLGFDKSKIWASVYQDDDEAYDIWNKDIGLPESRIVRLGKEDNFWGPAGETGACGPCSELYIDKGEEQGCGSPDCKPGCDCERYMEYWNLVFNQYNMNKKGEMEPLPRTGIDTGMGLERLATICQNVTSIYETDELKSFTDFVCKELNIRYEGDNIVPVNVIVEHARSLTFAMSDGAYPSNEGRGYVLRRILRRALRFSRTLGVKEPFLYKLVDPIVEVMGAYYPEIVDAKENIKKVMEGEEKRFLETLEKGMERITELMDDAVQKSEKEISGEEAFVLYDTYGFPVEMTQEMALEKGLSVNMSQFEEEMEKQRIRGKQSWKSSDSGDNKILTDLASECGTTDFLGYTEYKSDSLVLAIVVAGEKKDNISEGESGYVFLDKTPFYGESGGQLGDRGTISSQNAILKVSDTKKINKTIVHHVTVESGTLVTGDTVNASIDAILRNLTKANHTVTHLLQAALREVLGSHVKQSGSQVGPDRMRFDFSHFNAMTDEEIDKVEKLVNRVIWENLPVSVSEMNIDDALKLGAMAEFGEKYEDVVRVIQAGDFSIELCGGTHVDNTVEIGLFKILKESSPGAGTRRIEGITLKGVYDRYEELNTFTSNVAELLGTAEHNLFEKIKQQDEELSALKKELEAQKSKNLLSGIDDILKSKEEVNGTSVILFSKEEVSANDLRSISDMVRQKEANSVIFLASAVNGKVLLLCAATKSAVSKGVHCGNVIKECAKLVGGGGGGRPDMAQAGGKNPADIEKAVKKAAELLKSQLQ